MSNFAFIPAGALPTRAPTRPSLTPIRQNRLTTPRRIRVSVRSPTATLQPQDDTPDPTQFEDVMRQFTLSALGIYAALDRIGAAVAVPEGLVEAFKSKPASLAHPAIMWVLLATCIYTFYLGYQSSLIRKSEPEKRKELVKAKVTDRHFKISSALFAVMTCATFSGMANTYARTGKLFPGPHLYAGLGLVATMSVMAAFVPYMQKGKNWARNSHFTIAFGALALFGWQAKSGMAIVGKLLGWN